jgi:lysophospholipase L1-like esterase
MGARVVLVFVGVVVALAAGEVGMRVARPEARQLFQTPSRRESERGKFCEYDAVRGWRGVKDADADFEYLDTHHHVHQNRWGSRGTEIPLERSEKRRIVVLGDSFVWGFGVGDAQLFTELVARDTGDEVVNLGVSGYGTDQELLMWRQLGIQFGPDVVLLVVSPSTDVYDVLRLERYGHAKPRFRTDPTEGLALENVPVPQQLERPWNFEATTAPSVPPPSLLVHAASRSALVAGSVLALAREPAARAWMERAGWLPPRQPGTESENLLFGTPLDRETRDGFSMLGLLVLGMAADVKAAGAELVVTSVPMAAQVDDTLREELVRTQPPPDGRKWDFDAPDRMMKQICAAAGVRYVDLLPDLRAAARADPYLYYRSNLHWTAAGHRVVASTLGGALQPK